MPVPSWWREAVVYQVYPRSFADGGVGHSGEGDLRGLIGRLDHLSDLGVDALWLCPFYPSPMVDGGYDVADPTGVDPRYGTLADAEELVAAAHARGLRVLIDVVPNHVSSAHPWFAAALAAGPGSPERARFLFRDGRGAGGQEPPNNWRSVFGGSSWTRVVESDGRAGQWYYHLFAAEQPDLDWSHPQVLAETMRVLRFWLDRGVDGFRIDVADALVKDLSAGDTPDGSPVIPKGEGSGVHAIYRALRRVLDEAGEGGGDGSGGGGGERVAVIETGAEPEVVALFLRPDEMHLAFSFELARAPWEAAALRAAIEQVLAANALVGAPATWVTDNHDTSRSLTRYARASSLQGAYVPTSDDAPSSPGPRRLTPQERARGTARARAAAVLLLTLPGAAFLYQGQELGLEEVEDLPDSALADPAVARSGGTVRGRDGCRVPLPWSGDRAPFGFAPPGTATWLPQPANWAALTAQRQVADAGSMLALHRAVLALRRAEPSLRRGELAWLPAAPGVLMMRREAPGAAAALVVVNLSGGGVDLPAGEVLVRTDSAAADDVVLPADAAAVLRVGD